MIKYKLTAKEEEVMNHFWDRGALFVKDLLEQYDDPKPHFNTLSTIVRALEERGFLSHKSFGNSHQYYVLVTREEFNQLSLKNVIGKYYNNSALAAVSSLVKEESISLDDLRKLIDLVEKQ